MLFYRIVSWLPLPLLYGGAWVVYLITYHVAGYRKAVVMDNLREAFPDKSAREITVLAKKFYRQLAEVSVEIIRGRRMTQNDYRARVTLRNPELVRACSDNFQHSIIVMAIHQGNWEWMLHGATSTLDFPIDPVYKPLHNRSADRFIYELRSQFGARPVPVAEAARDILRNRRTARIIAMVADQAPIRRERTLWTPFMHREAAFYLGAEALARTAGFPVLFASCHRRSRGHYEVEFHEVARPPYGNDDHEITRRFVTLAEQAIRKEPQSWLWSNRRWKRNRETSS